MQHCLRHGSYSHLAGEEEMTGDAIWSLRDPRGMSRATLDVRHRRVVMAKGKGNSATSGVRPPAPQGPRRGVPRGRGRTWTSPARPASSSPEGYVCREDQARPRSWKLCAPSIGRPWGRARGVGSSASNPSRGGRTAVPHHRPAPRRLGIQLHFLPQPPRDSREATAPAGSLRERPCPHPGRVRADRPHGGPHPQHRAGMHRHLGRHQRCPSERDTLPLEGRRGHAGRPPGRDPQAYLDIAIVAEALRRQPQPLQTITVTGLRAGELYDLETVAVTDVTVSVDGAALARG